MKWPLDADRARAGRSIPVGSLQRKDSGPPYVDGRHGEGQREIFARPGAAAAARRARRFHQAPPSLSEWPGIVRSKDRIDIDCEAEDEEMLLVAWVNALIYEMATRRRPAYDGEAARRLAQASGWTMAPGWRRISVAWCRRPSQSALELTPPRLVADACSHLHRRGWHSRGSRQRSPHARCRSRLDKDVSAHCWRRHSRSTAWYCSRTATLSISIGPRQRPAASKPQRPPNCGSSRRQTAGRHRRP